MKTNEASEPRWLRTGEAAKIMRVSISSVRRMCEAGELRFRWQASLTGRTCDVSGHELRGRRMVDPQSVEMWLIKRR